MKAEEPISSWRLLYPLLKGYDLPLATRGCRASGQDQKFKLLSASAYSATTSAGAKSIMNIADPARIDGGPADEQSNLANYVGFTDPHEEMVGKL